MRLVVLAGLLDLFLHIDRHLQGVIDQYQTATYLILFVIVFVETGLVVMPFLPGDSLLFAAGALAGAPNSPLNVLVLVAILILAALSGDNVNYFVGNKLGMKLFSKPNSKLFRREHLVKTHAFFERYGGKTIIMARFVPIVRTFTPFVAGVGAMKYRTFIGFSVLAAVLWVGICTFAGYFFGRIPIVQKNFSLVVVAIIFISVVPMAIELVKARREKHRKSNEATDAGA